MRNLTQSSANKSQTGFNLCVCKEFHPPPFVWLKGGSEHAGLHAVRGAFSATLDSMFSLHPEGMKVIPTHSKRITLVDLEETQPGKQAKRPASVDKWLQLGTVERLCVLRDAIHFTSKHC